MIEKMELYKQAAENARATWAAMNNALFVFIPLAGLIITKFRPLRSAGIGLVCISIILLCGTCRWRTKYMRQVKCAATIEKTVSVDNDGYKKSDPDFRPFTLEERKLKKTGRTMFAIVGLVLFVGILFIFVPPEIFECLGVD